MDTLLAQGQKTDFAEERRQGAAASKKYQDENKVSTPRSLSEETGAADVMCVVSLNPTCRKR